jgi:hypothetical protein
MIARLEGQEEEVAKRLSWGSFREISFQLHAKLQEQLSLVAQVVLGPGGQEQGREKGVEWLTFPLQLQRTLQQPPSRHARLAVVAAASRWSLGVVAFGDGESEIGDVPLILQRLPHTEMKEEPSEHQEGEEVADGDEQRCEGKLHIQTETPRFLFAGCSPWRSARIEWEARRRQKEGSEEETWVGWPSARRKEVIWIKIDLTEKAEDQ